VAESSVNVTEGSGKRLRTFDRTISSTLVQEQVFQHGEPYLPTYSIVTRNTAVSTTDAHALQIMAGSSLHVRINSIRVYQYNTATAAGMLELMLYRLTTAGTGGTSITPRPYDTAEAASGCTAMTLPSSKGTEGVQVGQLRLPVLTAAPLDDPAEWIAKERAKPIIIPAGTSNGIALKVYAGIATTTSVSIWVEVTETAWL
jgi:hypothetical protein